ncbi:chromatin assembly factor 1 subunit a [Venturia nashicola]|nr:chromatin assembly factor 1 subunit a [Venturia nashicola]
MADTIVAAPSPKRQFPKDEPVDDEMPNAPTKADSTIASSPLSSPADTSSRDVSELPPIANVARTPPPTSNPSLSNMPTSSSQKTAPSAKRRKLNPVEKAQAEAEKAAKKEAKEKEKAAKEKEKAEAAAKKEEDRKKKAEEQEQKRKAKEMENKAKEEEKLRKAAEAEAKKNAREEAKLKKERVSVILPRLCVPFAESFKAQPRLTNFFMNPKPSSPAAPLSESKLSKAPPSPSPAKFLTKDDARRKSLSLEPGERVESLFADIPKLNLTSNSRQQIKNMRFLPFSVPTQTTVAAHNRFLPLEEELARVNEHLDSYFKATPDKATAESDSDPSPQFKEVLAHCKEERGYVPLPVQDIIERIHESSHQTVDLTSDSDDGPEALLQLCTMKYLHFGQDVRPPYCGTWTKPQSLKRARQLARNPFQQLLPQLDYDYDSEAEWEEPEEGEDVDSDGEEDEEEADEDMEGFLDDENPPDYLQGRKGQMSNDLVPVCTGLQWEDASGVLHAADGGQAADFSNLKMGALLDPRPPTIDPFTYVYWEEEVSFVAPPNSKEPGLLPGMGLMNPPRVPLQDRPHGFNSQLTASGKIPKATKAMKAGHMVSTELLPAFKQEIAGSTMTKLAMLEHLKAKFPKCKKDDLHVTLTTLAHRTGSKVNDKRWTLLEDNEK